MVLPYFSAVPAQAVPAQFTIAWIGSDGYSYYRYIGHQPLLYFDYVNCNTNQILWAVPGNIYAMRPVSNRAGLSEPPPDSWRWNPDSAYIGFFTPFREHLSVSRRVNSALQASIAAKPYRQSPGVPVTVKTAKEKEPSRASIMTSDARKRNAELQARIARGEKIGN